MLTSWRLQVLQLSRGETLKKFQREEGHFGSNKPINKIYKLKKTTLFLNLPYIYILFSSPGERINLKR